MSIYRWLKRNLRHPRIDWQTAFFLIIIALQTARLLLQQVWPNRLWVLSLPTPIGMLAVFGFSVATISIPIKIWNLTRIEMKLEEQEKLLLEARLDALQSQINPHFLFNTLNSISSLVRFDPDMARDVIFKLATILRRLLNTSEAFAPLREEFEFIDNYLDIEVVRFGRDKLHVVKELDPASLDVVVPSMLLQPLVENSIKHGLSPKIEGGSIFLRSRVANSRLIIEVEDDGVGMGSAQLEESSSWAGMGIGMANISERLHVLYGDTARMTIDSHQGKGTLIRIRLPLVEADSSVPEGFYAERSITRR
jgi:two-component system LytT family sensor kinase